jgi:large subunit ribosomal protein L28
MGCIFVIFNFMSRVCQLSGKRPSVGYRVSHSKRHVKRRFLPNLIWKKIYDPLTKKMVRIRIAAKTYRTLKKKQLV